MSNNKNNEVGYHIYLDKDLRQEFKLKTIKKNTSMKFVVLQAIKDFVNGEYDPTDKE